MGSVVRKSWPSDVVLSTGCDSEEEVSDAVSESVSLLGARFLEASSPRDDNSLWRGYTIISIKYGVIIDTYVEIQVRDRIRRLAAARKGENLGFLSTSGGEFDFRIH